MQGELFHIYGPISIHSYGVAIVVGLLLSLWLMHRHPLYTKLNLDAVFAPLLTAGIIAGIIGGRILYFMTQPADCTYTFLDVCSFWEGGFSILGAVIAVLATLLWCIRSYKINPLPLLDLLTLHAPLLQAIARIGCFFAGCCYGAPSNLPWAIHAYSACNLPAGVAIHPTQLYSALMLFGIFLFLYGYVQHAIKVPGIILCSYLTLVAGERFFSDFFRAQRLSVLHAFGIPLSMNQLIALCLISVGIAGGYLLYRQSRRATVQ